MVKILEAIHYFKWASKANAWTVAIRSMPAKKHTDRLQGKQPRPNLCVVLLGCSASRCQQSMRISDVLVVTAVCQLC